MLETLKPEAAAPPSSPEQQISLLDILIAIGTRKWFIVKTTFFVAVIAALFSLLLPVRYTSTATIMPPQQTQSPSSALLTAQLGNLGALAGNSLGLKNPNDLYVSLLKSRTVESAVVNRFQLLSLYGAKKDSDARKALEGHCTIESSPKDGLIRISVVDKSANRAAEIANGYVDEYKKFSASLAITEASQRRLFFEQQLEQAKQNLATAEENAKSSQLKSGMIQLDGQAKALIESVAALKAQVAAKEVQIRAMTAFETNTNPEVILAREQLAGLNEQLRRLTGAAPNSDDLIIPKNKIPEAGLDYVHSIREVKYREAIFELLAKQYEAAKLDEAKQGAIIQVVDPATPPDRRSSPNRTLIVIVFTILALFGAILWTLIQEAVSQLKASPEDWQRLRLLKRVWTS